MNDENVNTLRLLCKHKSMKYMLQGLAQAILENAREYHDETDEAESYLPTGNYQPTFYDSERIKAEKLEFLATVIDRSDIKISIMLDK